MRHLNNSRPFVKVFLAASRMLFMSQALVMVEDATLAQILLKICHNSVLCHNLMSRGPRLQFSSPRETIQVYLKKL